MEIGTAEESEKLIYVHVVRRGPDRSRGSISGYMGATNHWYVIKQGGDTDEGATISPVFEDIDQLNHPGRALISTNCEVIGSSIYVIGGRDVLERVLGCGSNDETGSNKIRCIDTRNPTDGWKTCFTMPFRRSGGKSCVAVDRDGRWLYVFRGNRHDRLGLFPNYWGYAVNLDDENKSYSIPKPNFFNLPLAVRTPAYPPSWVVASKNDLPCPPRGFLGGCTVSDGILYIYNSDEMRLTSYDMARQEELYSVDLPDSIWFGRDEFVRLIVLASPYKLCVIWEEYGRGCNSYFLNYTRFSVSASKSTVIVHESRTFPISCFRVLNIVTL